MPQPYKASETTEINKQVTLYVEDATNVDDVYRAVTAFINNGNNRYIVDRFGHVLSNHEMPKYVLNKEGKETLYVVLNTSKVSPLVMKFKRSLPFIWFRYYGYSDTSNSDYENENGQRNYGNKRDDTRMHRQCQNAPPPPPSYADKAAVAASSS